MWLNLPVETRQQRCWVNKIMNVLYGLPKPVQTNAMQTLHAIWQAKTKVDTEKAFERNVI